MLTARMPTVVSTRAAARHTDNPVPRRAPFTSRRMRLQHLAVHWLALTICGACVGTTSGRVFVDRDRDGVFSPGDAPLSRGHVFYETSHVARLDASGHFHLRRPARPGLLWVRAPDDIAPGPYHVAVSSAAEQVEIPVQPTRARGPFRFVIASDTHVGRRTPNAAAQLRILQQATNLTPRPYFLAITGDIVQGPSDAAFGSVQAAVRQLDVPYVPIPGGHDWYDGGALYRRYFGPPDYSFDAGGMHFVVLQDREALSHRLDFLDRDLALMTDDRDVVVLMHRPPDDALLAGLSARGVDYLMTGHLHASRILRHDGFVEYNTQPLFMGGLDQSPAGYRVFVGAADGGLSSRSRTVVDDPLMTLVAPAREQVVRACAVQLVVALEPGVPIAHAHARIDGSAPVALSFTGGWNHVSEPLAICEPGVHDVALEATATDGSRHDSRASFTVGPPMATPRVGEWPMLQGAPGHTGASRIPFAPPVRPLWATSVGGHVQGGAPVVADGRLFVTITDHDGRTGGVAAFRAATGESLWRHRTGYSVGNAPAATGDTVVVVAQDGTVHALDVHSGSERWSYELAPHNASVMRTSLAAPTVVDRVVYAGVRGELAALDLDSGEALWSIEPLPGRSEWASHNSPAVAGDTLVMSFDHGRDGLLAYDRHTGVEAWRSDPSIANYLHGSAVLADDTVYVADELTQVSALDMHTGATRWTTALEEDARPWSNRVVATPAYDAGLLFIATQRGILHALDARTGDQVWAFVGQMSSIRVAATGISAPAFPGSPALAPGVVWIAGADGVLRALEAATGVQMWSYDLGVPVTASLALAGDTLFVASYDGSVRAFTASDPTRATPPPHRRPPTTMVGTP